MYETKKLQNKKQYWRANLVKYCKMQNFMMEFIQILMLPLLTCLVEFLQVVNTKQFSMVYNMALQSHQKIMKYLL